MRQNAFAFGKSLRPIVMLNYLSRYLTGTVEQDQGRRFDTSLVNILPGHYKKSCESSTNGLKSQCGKGVSFPGKINCVDLVRESQEMRCCVNWPP